MRWIGMGLGLVVGLLAAAIALPPLYFAIFPTEMPELPAAGRRIEVGGGVAVNAIERGAGPPVVLVHGLPGSAYDWAPLTEALAGRGLRVIAYDRVGYGRSDGRADGDFSPEANSRDLLVLLESEGLMDATVVGWSYGGPISIGAAAQDRSRIGRLVLVGSGGPSDDEPPPQAPSPAAATISGWILRWVGAVPPARVAAQRAGSAAAFSDGPIPDWWLRNLAANFALPRTASTWQSEIAALFAAIDSADEPPVAEIESLPILLIHGDQDRLASLGASRWIAERAKSAELLVVEGGSHMLPITHTDLLADRIAAHVRAGDG